MPLKRVRGSAEGVRRVRARCSRRARRDAPSLRVGHRARRRAASGSRRSRSSSRDVAAAARRSRSRRRSAPSSARTPAPARSASSGSTTRRRSRGPPVRVLYSDRWRRDPRAHGLRRRGPGRRWPRPRGWAPPGAARAAARDAARRRRRRSRSKLRALGLADRRRPAPPPAAPLRDARPTRSRSRELWGDEEAVIAGVVADVRLRRPRGRRSIVDRARRRRERVDLGDLVQPAVARSTGSSRARRCGCAASSAATAST